MNTKIVMIVCAGMLGVMGLVLSFLPQELATYLGWADIHPVVLQMLGALYTGFAIMNWTAKANLIGGIYGKPIALGNFTHFTIGALALVKSAMPDPSSVILTGLTLLYAIFAAIFGYIVFTHPRLKSKEKATSSRLEDPVI